MHRLSCKRCQHKKLKCSRSEPCDKCLKATAPCEYRQVDRKRRPASHDHVVLLQSRISYLEDFILKLRDAEHAERDDLLRAVSLAPSPFALAQGLQQESHSLLSLQKFENPVLHPGPKGVLSYHGPTSIYRVYTDAKNTEGNDQEFVSRSELSPNVGAVIEHFGIDINASIVAESLMQFFKWQYPHFMFIYRDAFLRDHFGDRNASKYWSIALLLSICALGSLTLENACGRYTSEQFFGAAESIALVTGLTRPSIVTVQVFLCLAFYEIGRGNASKGWAYSGIGFRMAQELGFQKDPKSWIIHDASITTLEDLEIRRRIYWGCYISDKLISLILGRPVYLGHSDGEVEHLQQQVDSPFMKPWRSVGFDDEGEVNNSMIPYIKEQIKLSQAIERVLGALFNFQSESSALTHQQLLDRLNLELSSWKAQLPPWADLNKWDPIAQPLKPSLAALHLLFHSARIALNFGDSVLGDVAGVERRSRDICLASVDEITSLIRKLRYQYGLKHSPIILVYAIVQAGRAVRSFGTTEVYDFLLMALSECSVMWNLAQQMEAIMFPGLAKTHLANGNS